jgi:hypothetical protein
VIATLPAGAVLFSSGAFVYYALRGPSIDLPRSPFALLVVVVAIVALGHAARLAALAISWGVDQLWAGDIFNDGAVRDFLDEIGPRKLGPELAARVSGSVKAALGVDLPSLGRADDEATRDKKARTLDEVFTLARARAAATAPEHVASLESNVQGARALFAALLLSTILVLGTAVHDLFFAQRVAHAFSSFSIVVMGVLVAFATLAALGQARLVARRLALDVLLIVDLRSPGK